MQAQFLEHNDKRVRLMRAGSGPALLLLHPIGHSADVFLHNIDPLSRHFEVIAPDLPGHGFSDSIAFNQASPQQATAQWLTSIMQQLGHDRWAVAGSSYGGLVAAWMALTRPASVSHLIIIGSGSTFGDDRNQEAKLLAVKANASTAMLSPTLEACMLRVRNICYAGADIPQSLAYIQMNYYALPDRYEAFCHTIDRLIASAKEGEGRAVGRLSELKMPVLAIVGREDIRADYRSHQTGVQKIDDARCEIIEACGHLPHLEHPRIFNTLVEKFLLR